MPTGSAEHNFPKVFNEGFNGIRDSIPEHMRQTMFREYYNEKEVEDTHMVYVPLALPIPLGLDTIDYPFKISDSGKGPEVRKNRATQDAADRALRIYCRNFFKLARNKKANAFPDYTNEDDFPCKVSVC